MVIGLLPASGNVKRLGGLPKFSLPISDNTSLLENHIILMREVCDEVRISTRSGWIRILENMNLDDATIIDYEPPTMLDAPPSDDLYAAINSPWMYERERNAFAKCKMTNFQSDITKLKEVINK